VATLTAAAPDAGDPSGRRAALRATTPPAYRWWRHAGLIVAFTLAGLAIALWQLDDPGPGEWLACAGMLLFTNFGEYAAHRWNLHVRTFPRAVYHRHVAEHHGFFTHEHMAVDTWDDLRWVLFPPWALPLLVATVLPLTVALALVLPPNYPWLLVLAVVGYYGLYEVLHALAHLPDGHALAGSAPVRAFTRHHRLHHDPALMRRWNFNFAIPLFDRLFGTRYAPAATRAAARAGS
jgi:hypothetical protein